jgi:hypothetical protein
MNFILTNVDGRGRVGCLFIDLQKAFDCVDHAILLEKLRAVQIVDLALSLLASYLDGRKQFLKINGVNSEAQPIVMGIAQGSVLRATLFLIFINDIFNLRLHGKIQLYVDDSVLMYTLLVIMQPYLNTCKRILLVWATGFHGIISE